MQIIKKASSLVKAVSAEPPTLAECDPSQTLRTRIRADLNVKGLVGCPCKIDMKSIIPVYDFADHTKLRYVTAQPALNLGINGVTNQPVNLWECSLLPDATEYEELTAFYSEIQIDAAGRAAMVLNADEVRMHLRFTDTLAGVTIEIATAFWAVTASPLIALRLIAGNKMRGIGAAASEFSAPNIFEFLPFDALRLPHRAGNLLWIELECTNPFQANTTATVNAVYSFK